MDGLSNQNLIKFTKIHKTIAVKFRLETNKMAIGSIKLFAVFVMFKNGLILSN